jgi:hypothetical protein
MANYVRVISDTKTHAKILLSFHNDSSTTASIIDASTLSGHQNGAKLHITNIRFGLGGQSHVQLEFVGTSANVHALTVAGSGEYATGVIKNNATNASASGGDITSIADQANGFILLTLQKEGMGENS